MNKIEEHVNTNRKKPGIKNIISKDKELSIHLDSLQYYELFGEMDSITARITVLEDEKYKTKQNLQSLMLIVKFIVK